MLQLILAATLLVFAGQADSNQSAVVQPPGFKLGNRSAVDLSVEWWKWAISSPDEINPVKDTSGVHCGIGQEGSVWFLAGGFGSSKIKRSCLIPSGKYIFFPIVNMAYYPREENNGATCQQAKANAAVNNDTALNLFVEVDGVPVKNPKKYRARTDKCFDMFERIPKAFQPFKGYPSASDGYWILLKPLQSGRHTIKFSGKYNGTTDYGQMVQDIEYDISVK